MNPPVITIDGPAASGKSSVSRELAQKLGWRWVSTGAFYRGIGYVAQKKGVDLKNELALVDVIHKKDWEVKMTPEKTGFIFQGKDVSDEVFVEEMGTVASQISQFPLVRKHLLQAQRDLSKTGNGLIAEGRDCGSVVFPEADVKIYLTADSESRAQRRAEEQGDCVTETIKAQKQRDKQDSTRKTAPLHTPEGAHVIDTSDLRLDEVVLAVFQIVNRTLKL